MQYRKDMHGEIKCSALAVGIGSMDAKDAEALLERAIGSGVSMFDLCAGTRKAFEASAAALGRARENIQLALHIGAAFDELGEYEWTRDMDVIKRNFRWQLKQLNTDHADIGVIHCIDDEDDVRVMQFEGMLEYAKKLKRAGTLRALAFSTHRPHIAVRLLDMGAFDAAFINFGPESPEGRSVMERCRDEGVSVYAMGIFGGGDLIRNGLTPAQCLKRVLEMPGVVSAIAGVTTIDQLDTLLESI